MFSASLFLFGCGVSLWCVSFPVRLWRVSLVCPFSCSWLWRVVSSGCVSFPVHDCGVSSLFLLMIVACRLLRPTCLRLCFTVVVGRVCIDRPCCPLNDILPLTLLLPQPYPRLGALLQPQPLPRPHLYADGLRPWRRGGHVGRRCGRHKLRAARVSMGQHITHYDITHYDITHYDVTALPLFKMVPNITPEKLAANWSWFFGRLLIGA